MGNSDVTVDKVTSILGISILKAREVCGNY
jgi:hypothetical protein